MHYPYETRRAPRRSRDQQVVPRQLAVEIAQERDQLYDMVMRLKAQNEELQTRLAAEAERRQAQMARPVEMIPAESDTLTSLRDEHAELQETLVRTKEQMRALEARLETMQEHQTRALKESDEAQSEREKALARAESRAQNLLKDLSRLKNRHDLELSGSEERARREAILSFLPMRDNLMRALELLDDRDNPWAQGMEQLLEQFDVVLTSHEIVELAKRGDLFDPSIHEAVGAAPLTEEIAPGEITHVARQGFSFGDQGTLIRPAQVVVASGS